MRMNKEFIKNFKKEREDMKYTDFLCIVEDLSQNLYNEEDIRMIDNEIKEVNLLWKILKKSMKKDKRW